MIRRLGPDAYDRWTDGELPFDSPALTSRLRGARRPAPRAGRDRRRTPRRPEHTVGGHGGPPAERAGDMPHGASGGLPPPRVPAGTQIGPDGDIDFFVLPSVDGASAPLLLGGTLAAPLSDDESVSAAMQLIASRALAERLNQTHDFLSPHLGVDRATVTDAITRPTAGPDRHRFRRPIRRLRPHAAGSRHRNILDGHARLLRRRGARRARRRDPSRMADRPKPGRRPRHTFTWLPRRVGGDRGIGARRSRIRSATGRRHRRALGRSVR